MITRYGLALFGDWLYIKSLFEHTLNQSSGYEQRKPEAKSKILQTAEKIKEIYPLSHFAASPLTMEQQAIKDAEREENKTTYEDRAKKGTLPPQ